MIFVCHSSIDREKIVKPILFHLYNFGFDIWYDQKKLFLSDNIEEKIYRQGIVESSDILIIYSLNLTENSKCGRNELNIIYQNARNKNIYPVLVNSKMEDYCNTDFDTISKNIHYLATSSNSQQIAVQIAIKILEKALTNQNVSTNISESTFGGNLKVYETYCLLPAFSLNDHIIYLICFINLNLENKNVNNCKELNLIQIINSYISRIHLLYDFTENDLKLLELICIMITNY